MGNNS
jgi:hypothetical protein